MSSATIKDVHVWYLSIWYLLWQVGNLRRLNLSTQHNDVYTIRTENCSLRHTVMDNSINNPHAVALQSLQLRQISGLTPADKLASEFVRPSTSAAYTGGIALPNPSPPLPMSHSANLRPHQPGIEKRREIHLIAVRKKVEGKGSLF